MRSAVLVAVLLLPPAALAADILSARYDAAAGELVVEIAYRGTRPDHDFRLEWGRCEPGGSAVARLIDRQGSDAAREDFHVIQRFNFGSLQCRPAEVTLRLGRVAHANVAISGAAADAGAAY